MDFTNKNIVITGATSGIGLHLTRTLLQEEQCRICAVGRDDQKLSELAKEFGGRLFPVKCDLKSQPQIDSLIDTLFTRCREWPGTVDIFFSNAGYAYYEALGEKSYAHFEDLYKLNVIAPMYLLSKLTGRMKNQTFQYVVTASGLSRMPIPGYTLYSSTKFAIDGYVRAYQLEKPDHLILSTVYPVAVKTPFYENSPKTMVVPVLRQSIEGNTRRILKGVRRNRKYIYPSIPYQLFLVLRRILPLTSLYGWIEKKRLQNWKENQR